MILKALIVVVVICIVALGVLGFLLRNRDASIRALAAEKAQIQQKLDAANADMEVSVGNHNRIVAEKDMLLSSVLAQKDAELAAAVSMASIKKDIANVPDGRKCVESAPVGAMLDGLRDIQHAGGGGKADDRIHAARPARPAAGVP